MGLLLLTALSRSGKRKILRNSSGQDDHFCDCLGIFVVLMVLWGDDLPSLGDTYTILHDLARSCTIWGDDLPSLGDTYTILHDLARSCIALNIFALAQESQQGALHCITLKTIHYAIHYGAMQCQNVREPYLSWFRYITCLHTYRDWDMHKQIYQQEYWCIYIYIYTLLLL